MARISNRTPSDCLRRPDERPSERDVARLVAAGQARAARIPVGRERAHRLVGRTDAWTGSGGGIRRGMAERFDILSGRLVKMERSEVGWPA